MIDTPAMHSHLSPTTNANEKSNENANINRALILSLIRNQR
jgi:hypothetical protein